MRAPPAQPPSPPQLLPAPQWAQRQPSLTRQALQRGTPRGLGCHQQAECAGQPQAAARAPLRTARRPRLPAPRPPRPCTPGLASPAGPLAARSGGARARAAPHGARGAAAGGQRGRPCSLRGRQPGARGRAAPRAARRCRPRRALGSARGGRGAAAAAAAGAPARAALPVQRAQARLPALAWPVWPVGGAATLRRRCGAADLGALAPAALAAPGRLACLLADVLVGAWITVAFLSARARQALGRCCPGAGSLGDSSRAFAEARARAFAFVATSGQGHRCGALG